MTEARADFTEAIGLCGNEAERAHLEDRLAALG